MPSPIDVAKADLARKETQLQNLQRDIEQIKAFIAMYGRYASGVATAATPARSARPKKEVVGDAVADILTRHGPYCSIAELLEKLREMEVEVGTNNEKQALSSMLGRDGRFKHEHGKGWSFTAYNEGSGSTTPEPSLEGVAGSQAGDPHQVPPVGSTPTTSTSVSAAEEQSRKEYLFGDHPPASMRPVEPEPGGGT